MAEMQILIKSINIEVIASVLKVFAHVVNVQRCHVSTNEYKDLNYVQFCTIPLFFFAETQLSDGNFYYYITILTCTKYRD